MPLNPAGATVSTSKSPDAHVDEGALRRVGSGVLEEVEGGA